MTSPVQYRSPVDTDSGPITGLFRQILENGFLEDIGFGDITSRSLFTSQRVGGEFLAKDTGVLAGVEAIVTGYRLLDPTIGVELYKHDGEELSPGDLIAEAEGAAVTLLSGERVILNLLQHLSGVATATAMAVEALQGSSTRVCDTRKTVPGLRGLQKYAVRCGGGFNHRLRLDDGVMIKDNHIAAAGGIGPAVEAIRAQIGLMVRIEVECETPGQIREAVAAGADIIMLDNKTPEEVVKLRKEIPSGTIVEISGGITPETIGSYRDCGADYISMGSLTHSVRALDISFNIKGGSKSGQRAVPIT